MFLWISFTVLRIGSSVSESHGVCSIDALMHWSNSRRQFLNRPEDGLAELILASSIYASAEGFADPGAG